MTQFTDAFVSVLRAGLPGGAERLALGTVVDLMMDFLNARYAEPVKPVLLSPRTGGGSVDRHPLFPNRARKEVAAFLPNVTAEQRAVLTEKVDVFIAELAACEDQVSAERKIDQTSSMGQKELREAAGLDQARESTRPLTGPRDISTQLRKLHRAIATVRPDGNSFLRSLMRWIDPARALRIYLAAPTGWVTDSVASLAFHKDQLLITNAEIDVLRATANKTMGKLEQMYLIAHTLHVRMRTLAEQLGTAKPEIADLIRQRALAATSERETTMKEAIKALEMKDRRLADCKATNIMMIKALDRLFLVLGEGNRLSVEAALDLLQLRHENKHNPNLEASLSTHFDRMLAEVAEVQALHDRSRGAQPL